LDNKRISFGRIPSVIDIPDLLGIQTETFEDFVQLDTHPLKREIKGLQQVFLTNFPIFDNKENYRLDFLEYYVEKPRFSVEECLERGLTFAAPLKAKLRLSTKDPETEEFINTVEQEVYLGNLPFMTEKGTFVINGAERVVVSQLHRSPGVAFAQTVHPNGTPIYSARIIPLRGSWVEFATDINYVMYVYIDRRKKFPATTLLRALGFQSDEEILKLFGLVENVTVKKAKLENYLGRMIASDIFDMSTGEIFLTRDSILSEEDLERINDAEVDVLKFIKSDSSNDQNLVVNTLRKDTSHTREEALYAIYRQLRSGEAPDLTTAETLIEKLFFNDKRYDLGDVGRHRMNHKLELNIPETTTVLTVEDIISIMRYIIDLKEGAVSVDDIDHLGNRRIRTVGEQLGQQFNVGMARMARTIKERMNMRDSENFTPQDLVNARTISSVINAFFGTNQLSQFMDQTNPLAEMTHKRRMSALGPGGLTRERAGFEVRDVHYTHYGRLCPIETPEGPNIGLISSLTIYARVNRYGFLETPYRKVVKGRVTEDVEYLTAEHEDAFTIAQANAPITESGKFVNERVKSRLKGEFPIVHPEDLQFMDVAPAQIVSAAAALIPFLEHDDANSALMGSNMQRQAVPLIHPTSPIVGTGLEGKVAMDSRMLINAEGEGTVEYVDANQIVIKYDRSEEDQLVSFEDNLKTYQLTKFQRTNQATCINLKPIVKKGDRVHAGSILCDGYATDKGELALGQNLKVAFMPWKGYNFEDAIVISERVVQQDVFSSIHIESFDLDVRETKLGDEELTNDIPNVSEEATKDLDENGIIRIGAWVNEGDILIGKITPKGESDPTPEEKLLRAIFGDKAGDVKDASLKAPPSIEGVVISKQLFAKAKKDKVQKTQEKDIIDKLDQKHEVAVNQLKTILIDKLMRLLKGDATEGVKTIYGEQLLSKGTKITWIWKPCVKATLSI